MIKRKKTQSAKDSWFKNATEKIAESEYYIRFQEEQGLYQSVNRANNFRVSYLHDGFVIEPRTGEKKWKLDLQLSSINKGGRSLHASKTAAISVQNEQMTVIQDGFAVEYTNTTEGMRQNFVIERKPEGNNPLVVELAENSPLVPSLKDGDVLFVNESKQPVIYYKDLKVWDAQGTELSAKFKLDGEVVQLVVNDENAVYPVTIDPISQTPDWTFESDQTNAQLGFFSYRFRRCKWR